jgi:hypothetical protein
VVKPEAAAEESAVVKPEAAAEFTAEEAATAEAAVVRAEAAAEFTADEAATKDAAAEPLGQQDPDEALMAECAEALAKADAFIKAVEG